MPDYLTTLYYSSHGYTSRPGDTIENTHFDGRLVRPFTFSHQAPLGGGGARAPLSAGEIELDNADGELDELLDDYALDGRGVDVAIGEGRGAAWSSYVSAFVATVARARPGRRSIVLELRDALHGLEVPIQADLYGGTGGINGGEDLKGRPKPLAFGYCSNVAPVYLGVVDLGDGDLHTFQVHGGTVQDIPAVRIRGALQTAVAVAPAIGEFRAYVETGIFQLGSDPDGAVTADVEGDASPTFVSTTGEIIRRIITGRLAYTTADLDALSFRVFAVDAIADVGIYVGAAPVTALAVIETLLAGVSGYIHGNRAGEFRIAILGAPIADAAFTLRPADIRGLEPVALPASIDPPNKRRSVAWRRNWAPSNDLVLGLDAAERSFLSEAARIAAYFDTAIAARFRLATEPPLVPGLYYDGADALTEAARLGALYGLADDGRPRRLFRLVADKYLGKIESGYTGLIYWPEYGLAAGWRGVVVAWAEDLGAGTVELFLFG